MGLLFRFWLRSDSSNSIIHKLRQRLADFEPAEKERRLAIDRQSSLATRRYLHYCVPRISPKS